MWTEVLSAIGSVATPLVVVAIGYSVNVSLKRLEDQQWRNQELIKVRLQYYQQLAPLLNDLFCYFTFIGAWKEMSPIDVVRLKRLLDREFYSGSPLFNVTARENYEGLMQLCFATFGEWGQDARIRSGFYYRRRHYPGRWEPDWDSRFDRTVEDGVSANELAALREAYSRVLAALVADTDLTRSRTEYATAEVLANAEVWRRPAVDVPGDPDRKPAQ